MSDMNSSSPEINHGQLVAKLQAPFPVVHTATTKYYYNTVPNVSMHRADGQRIAFIFGIFKTNLKHDIEYLDAEIEAAHPNLRYATPQEIDAYKMRVDPRGTIKEQLLSDPEVMSSLEDKIRAEMEEKYANGFTVHKAGEDASQQNIAGTESALSKLKDGIQTGTGRLVPVSSSDIAANVKQSGK